MTLAKVILIVIMILIHMMKRERMQI